MVEANGLSLRRPACRWADRQEGRVLWEDEWATRAKECIVEQMAAGVRRTGQVRTHRR